MKEKRDFYAVYYRKRLKSMLHNIGHLPSTYFFHPLGNFNRRVGEKLFGRVNAGRVARLMRIVRGICAIATIAVAITLFVTGTITFTGGLALPIWAIAVGGAAMVINMFAIGFGMMANHMKIEESYDREHELLTANNQLMRPGEQKMTIPHGLGEYWRTDRRLFWMNLGRRIHDMNGVTGTVVSLIGLGIAVAPLIAGISLPIALTTTVAVSLFLVSRVSSSLSAFVANLTNSHRLWAYKKVLLRQMQKYNELSLRNNAAKATLTTYILDDIFAELKMNKAHSRYNQQIYFYCYKALYSFPGESVQISDAQRSAILSLIRSLGLDKDGSFIAKRQKLRAIDTDHEFHVERKTYKDKLSVMDALPILEKKIQTILLDNAPNPLDNLRIDHSYNDATKCLGFTAAMAQRENPKANVAQKLQRYLTAEGRINQRLLATENPVRGHPHRFSFFQGYHLPLLQKKLAISNDRVFDNARLR